MTTGPPGVGRESHNRELLLRLGTWEVVGFVGWLFVCICHVSIIMIKISQKLYSTSFYVGPFLEASCFKVGIETIFYMYF